MSRLWVDGAAGLDRQGREALVVIGNFDGVHRGHQALLAEATEQAQGLLPVVLTFVPHPAEALGRVPPPMLTTLDRKAELLRARVPQVTVVAQGFDRAFASLSPEQFVAFLRSELGARAVVVGKNFHFGHGRAGNFATLEALGQQAGFRVQAVALRGDERGPWSSTRVRAALGSGDLADANRVLGRPHELEGTVVAGQQRARTLGFPTANLADIPQALPAYGVYAVRVARVGAESGQVEPLGEGVANIGRRPTVAAGFAVEAHIFDAQADLYGARLRVELVARLREERTFAGLDALKEQIVRDAAAARAALAEQPEAQVR